MSATSVTRAMALTGVLMAMAAWSPRPQAAPVIVQNEGQPPAGAQQTPATQGQTTAAPGQTRANGGDLVLLQRIEDILAKATASGDDLKSAGKVTMSRADVAEILALVRELKVKTTGSTQAVPR